MPREGRAAWPPLGESAAAWPPHSMTRAAWWKSSLIAAATHGNLTEFHRLASAGFIVVAPMYRGSGGAEGRADMGARMSTTC
ncbi:MAG TPA: hypothetical protein VII75_02505, partial [Thermoanaerobaculia bacterium]